MTLCFCFIGSGLGACSALTVSPITNLPGWYGKPFLHPVQGQFGVLTVSECLLRCSISVWSSSGLLHTVFAL